MTKQGNICNSYQRQRTNFLNSKHFLKLVKGQELSNVKNKFTEVDIKSCHI